LQLAADRNDRKKLELSSDTGSIRHHPLRTLDGEDILQDKNKILRLFAELVNQLLNVPVSTDHRTLNSFSQQPIVHSLDELPDEKEASAIERTKLQDVAVFQPRCGNMGLKSCSYHCFV